MILKFDLGEKKHSAMNVDIAVPCHFAVIKSKIAEEVWRWLFKKKIMILLIGKDVWMWKCLIFWNDKDLLETIDTNIYSRLWNNCWRRGYTKTKYRKQSGSHKIIPLFPSLNIVFLFQKLAHPECFFFGHFIFKN